MSLYKLRFHTAAQKEWDKLGHTVRQAFQKILFRRLEEPHVPSAALHGLPDCYKIKLREAGYRLVYQVEDNILYVSVMAMGRRDKSEVYNDAASRLD